MSGTQQIERHDGEAPAAEHDFTDALPPEDTGGEVHGGETDEGSGGQQRERKGTPGDAIAAERRRAREAEAQLRSFREETQRREEIVNRRLELLLGGGKTEQPAPIPDFMQDPQAHVAGRLGGIEQSVAALRQAQEQRQQAETQQTEAQQLVSWAQGHEQQFRSETPDYPQALNHLARARDHQLQIMGISDPGQRQQVMRKEATDVQAMAKRTGQNPAELLYNYSRTLGYQPAQQAPAQQEAGMRDDDVTRQMRGQQLAGPGNGGGGRAPQSGVVTAERLAAMSDAEFEKVMREKPHLVDKALGKR